MLKSLRLRTAFVALIAILASQLALVSSPASAVAPFQILAAPFECGTEWSGTTYSGHGQNNWNLDMNSTARTYAVPNYDEGSPILAQADGVVSWLGVHVRAGTYLDVDYGDYTVRYVHLMTGSIPPEVNSIGATVTQGQTIGLLGKTGNATHAHLHIEYHDSRGVKDAAGWQLSTQTQVTIDGVVINPGDVFVSTNCNGAPPPTTTIPPTTTSAAPPPTTTVPAPADPDLAAHVATLTEPTEAATDQAYIVDQLSQWTEALDGTTDPAAYISAISTGGANIIGRIPGTALATETVIVGAHYDRPSTCATANPICPAATDRAAGVALLLELAQRLAEPSAPAPRRTVVLASWDRTREGHVGSAAWIAANPTLAASAVAYIDYDIQGSSAVTALRSRTSAFGAESGGASMVDAVEQANAASAALNIDQFAATLSPDGDNLSFSGVGVPTVAFTDQVGPCVATSSDTADTVDIVKLTRQLDAAAGLVGTLASSDVATDATVAAAPFDDAATVAGLASHVGARANTLAELNAALIAQPCLPTRPGDPFTDIAETSYAYAEAAVLYDTGITTGSGPLTYSPKDPVTREQMAAFLARLWRLVHPNAAPINPPAFVDVSESSFAYDDIALLGELGITTGTTAIRFSPDDGVTRVQMAVFLARIWPMLVPSFDESVVVGDAFDDVATDDFGHLEIALIRHVGITTGTQPRIYSPHDLVTREQMAAFLARFMRAAKLI